MRRVSTRLGPISLLLLCISISSGCGRPWPSECKRFDKLFELPIAKQSEEMRGYSLRDQSDIYICGMHIEPPAMYLADPLADRGEEAVPALLERVQTEKEELTQRDIIYVFQVMSYRGRLRDSQDTVNQLRSVVSAMKNERHRRSAERLVDEIERNIRQ